MTGGAPISRMRLGHARMTRCSPQFELSCVPDFSLKILCQTLRGTRRSRYGSTEYMYKLNAEVSTREFRGK
jgi:hypothetical protein